MWRNDAVGHQKLLNKEWVKVEWAQSRNATQTGRESILLMGGVVSKQKIHDIEYSLILSGESEKAWLYYE